jgi:hypothetical protein
MLVEFTSDESISGPGFEASYTCGDGAREYVPVTTDGTVATVEIEAAGQQSWFSFQAMMGETYVISAVVQLTGAGPAADTEAVMHLYDTDGVTQLAENDEASLEGFETSANMEWCARIFCPPVLSSRVPPIAACSIAVDETILPCAAPGLSVTRSAEQSASRPYTCSDRSPAVTVPCAFAGRVLPPASTQC